MSNYNNSYSTIPMAEARGLRAAKLSVILADQIKSLDWKSREAEFGCDAPREVLNLVLEKLSTLLS